MDDPGHATARQFLRISHWARADAFVLLQKYDEAIADLDVAVSLESGATRDYFIIERARVLVLSGNAEKGLAQCEEIVAEADVVAELFYRAARVFALADKTAGVGQETELQNGERATGRHQLRALELLTAAKAKGYFRPPQTMSQLKTDPDLESLLENETFKKLFPPAAP